MGTMPGVTEVSRAQCLELHRSVGHTVPEVSRTQCLESQSSVGSRLEQGVGHGRGRPEATSVFLTAPRITLGACPFVFQ